MGEPAANPRAQFREDFEIWKVENHALIAESEWVVKDFRCTAEQFMVFFSVANFKKSTMEPASIECPKTYPSGFYFFERGKKREAIPGVSSVAEALNSVIFDLQKSVDNLGDDDEDEVEDNTDRVSNTDVVNYGDISGFGYDFYGGSNSMMGVGSRLIEIEKGWYYEIVSATQKEVYLNLYMDLSKRLNIPEGIIAAWGIDTEKSLTIKVTRNTDKRQRDAPFNSLKIVQKSKLPVMQHNYRVYDEVEPDEISFTYAWVLELKIFTQFLASYGKPSTPLEIPELAEEEPQLEDEEPEANPDFDSELYFCRSLLKFTETVVIGLLSSCTVCRKRIDVADASILPHHCNDKTCSQAYEIATREQAENFMRSNPDVLDLYIAALYAAVYNTPEALPSSNSVLFPTTSLSVRVVNAETLNLENLKFDNIEDVKKILDIIPNISMLREWLSVKSSTFKSVCDAYHPLLHSLLWWTITSMKHCYLTRVRSHDKIDCMRTRHQFMISTGPLGADTVFNKERMALGNFYAFYTTPLSNLYLILKEGFKPQYMHVQEESDEEGEEEEGKEKSKKQKLHPFYPVCLDTTTIFGQAGETTHKWEKSMICGGAVQHHHGSSMILNSVASQQQHYNEEMYAVIICEVLQGHERTLPSYSPTIRFVEQKESLRPRFLCVYPNKHAVPNVGYKQVYKHLPSYHLYM